MPITKRAPENPCKPPGKLQEKRRLVLFHDNLQTVTWFFPDPQNFRINACNIEQFPNKHTHTHLSDDAAAAPRFSFAQPSARNSRVVPEIILAQLTRSWHKYPAAPWCVKKSPDLSHEFVHCKVIADASAA